MAQFLVRNPLNPSKAVSLGITYRQLIDVNTKDGELIWVIELATDETTVSGLAIPHEFIYATSFDKIDDEIEKAVAKISSQINWEPLLEDTREPIVDDVYPSTYIASIYDSVRLKLIDLQPSAGIDFSSIKMIINDIDVSDDLIITGDEYDCQVEWRPAIRVFDTY
jgi:hypothetical protein